MGRQFGETRKTLAQFEGNQLKKSNLSLQPSLQSHASKTNKENFNK
jgi:hypothetical protein